jgi:hypothetical protein
MTSDGLGVTIGGALLAKLGRRMEDRPRKGAQPADTTNVKRKMKNTVIAARKVPGVT